MQYGDKWNKDKRLTSNKLTIMATSVILEMVAPLKYLKGQFILKKVFYVITKSYHGVNGT